jgi:hypothetical protein
MERIEFFVVDSLTGGRRWLRRRLAMHSYTRRASMIDTGEGGVRKMREEKRRRRQKMGRWRKGAGVVRGISFSMGELVGSSEVSGELINIRRPGW